MGLAKTAEPFVCGGSAATFASVVIHPIDLAKVCLQFRRMEILIRFPPRHQMRIRQPTDMHKVPAMLGRKGRWPHWGMALGLCPKYSRKESTIILRTKDPLCNGRDRNLEISTYFLSAVSASALVMVRSEKRSASAFGRPPIVQAASATCPYFCHGNGTEGNSNQLLILFHPLSLS